MSLVVAVAVAVVRERAVAVRVVVEVAVMDVVPFGPPVPPKCPQSK